MSEKKANPANQKGLLLALVFGALAVLIYMFAVVPAQDDLTATRKRQAEEDSKQTRIANNLKNANVEKMKLKTAEQRLEIYKSTMLEKRLGSFATHAREILDPIALGAGLSSISYPETSFRRLPMPDPKKPNSPEQLHVREAVKMTAKGSYQAAVSFLIQVEEQLPHVSLLSFRFSVNQSNPKQQDIAMTFEWPAEDPQPPPKPDPKKGRR